MTAALRLPLITQKACTLKAMTAVTAGVSEPVDVGHFLVGRYFILLRKGAHA